MTAVIIAIALLIASAGTAAADPIITPLVTFAVSSVLTATGYGAFSAAALTVGGVSLVGALSTTLIIGGAFGVELLMSRSNRSKPQFQLPPGPVPQEMELQALQARFYTYGQDRVGGAVFFQEVGGQGNHWLDYGIVLNCRPIDGVVTYYVDDEAWVTDTGTTVEPFGAPAGYYPQAAAFSDNVFWPTFPQMKWAIYTTLVYVPNQGPQPLPTGQGPIMFGEFRNATHEGSESEILYRDFPSLWTDDEHLGRGLACLYSRAAAMDTNTKASRYPRYLPIWSVVLRGQRVYDPRDAGQSFYVTGADLTTALVLKASSSTFITGGDYREDTGGIWSAYNSTWEYSTNPALQIADFLTCPAGLGLTYDDIRWGTFIEAAGDCDRLVPVLGGGTQAFARAHLSWSSSEEKREVLGKLLAACDGQLYEDEDGKVCLWIGKWEEPTVTLTEDDLAMPISFKPSAGVFDSDNVITPGYVEPRTNYSRNTSLYVRDEASIARVGERRASIDLMAVRDFNQAYRLAYRAMKRTNTPMRVECLMGPRGLHADGQRVIRLELPSFGVSGVFRVVSMFAQNIATISLSLHQVTGEMYDDVVPPFDPVNASLPGATITVPYTPPAPSGLTLSDSLVGGGAIISANVSAPSGDTVSSARFHYRPVDPTTSAPLGSGDFMPFSNFTGQYSGASPVIEGTNGVTQRFEVRAWFVNNGNPGPLSSSAFISISTFS